MTDPAEFQGEAMGGREHGWRGQGKARVARLSGRLVVRYEGLSTKGSRLQAPIRELFRKDYRHQRPNHGAFSVHIWIESAAQRAKFDIDNVAKACLDALTGVVWHDDSQVQSLVLERLPAARNAITIAIEEAAAPRHAGLEALLDEIALSVAGSGTG